MQLSPIQKNKLLQFYPELSSWLNQPVKSGIEEGLIAEILKKIQMAKGDKGDKPIKGKDYFTDDDIRMFADFLIRTATPTILKKATPIKGIHYKDGNNYILTPSDKKEIASQIEVPIVEKVVEKTETIKEILPKSIDVSRVEGAVSKKELEIEKKTILDGMAKVDGRIKLIDQRWHGAGLSKVSHDTTLTGDGTGSNPLSVVSSGGSGFQLPLTGTLNQTTFTWTTAPNAIVIDGQTYQKTQQDGASIWSGTTTTVLAFTPSSSVFAVA